MVPKLKPVAVDIPAATVISIIEAAATALQIGADGVRAVQVDLPQDYLGKVHPWCQVSSQLNTVPVADVRKMTPYVYIDGQPLVFEIDNNTDLLMCTDAGTAGLISVMVTLWCE
jgi:hypothetical protein